MAICKDCGRRFNPLKDQYYVLVVCPECLAKSPKNPFSGDHCTGKKDSRAGLRVNGQESENDYFGRHGD